MNQLRRLDKAMLRVAEAIHDAEPKPPGPTDQPVEFMKGPIKERYMKMAHAAINEWLVSDPRPSITVAPGALDDVPLVALIEFLRANGLVLAGTEIRKEDA